MLFNYQLYRHSIFDFYSRALQYPNSCLEDCFSLISFSFLIRIYRLENLQASKLFNYFYLSRYFLGHPLQVFFSKKYFVLGKTYYNLELGFFLNHSRMDVPLALCVFQFQPLVNLSLTRDYVISSSNFQWTLKDPSIFSERKTNTGLFDLQDPLVFTLFYKQPSKACSLILTKKLLSSLKFLF